MKVYIEPKPKGRSEGDAITHYEIEKAGGTSVDGVKYPTQSQARDAAKRQGYDPIMCAHVRVTDKGRPDHWRNCG